MLIGQRIKNLRLKLDLNQNDFATKAGITRSTLAQIETNKQLPTINTIKEIVRNFNVSYEWLISGHEATQQLAEEHTSAYITKKGIPLVNVEAIAGMGNTDFAIKESDIQEFYVVPDFKQINFMIRITGSSMYPKYSSGDIVACRTLHDPQYIQWNKVHILATRDQGILIKRLKKGSTPKHWLCVSDNKDYDPFEIPVKEVTGTALVIGVIRLE